MRHNTYICDMTHTYVTRHQRKFGTWARIWDMSENLGHDLSTHGTTHSYVYYDSFVRVTWLINIWDRPLTAVVLAPEISARDTTHSYMWHDSLVRVTWLTHMCDTPFEFWGLLCKRVWCIYGLPRKSVGYFGSRNDFKSDLLHLWRVTWPTHTCDRPYSCACPSNSVREAWHICKRDMTHSYVWRDFCIYVSWLIYMCDRPYNERWGAGVEYHFQEI